MPELIRASTGDTYVERPRGASWQRFLLIYLLVNAALCLFVFREALWGKAMLAPLQSLAGEYTYYQFMAQGQNAPPKMTILGQDQDQVSYDLPMQHLIYESYRQGKIPWWNPYGLLGRPLLADAHANATDPVRLAVYALLPFVWAYNWVAVLHFILCGLSMALLARRLGFRDGVALLLGLTFEFAGCQGHYFGYPWIMGSLLYYPLLWLLWDSALERRRGFHLVLASLVVAGIFNSGNLQSHAYLPIFSAAFLLGYAGWRRAGWRRVFPLVAISLFFGACLAAPILAGQLDLFINGARGLHPLGKAITYLEGLASLTSIYPWALGSCRSLDVRNVLFSHIDLGVGFNTFIGSAALVLAFLGIAAAVIHPPRGGAHRAAIWLWIVFLAALSSPLRNFFYFRCAGLIVLGQLILVGYGIDFLCSSRAIFRRAGWSLAGLALAIAVITNVMAWIVYPRILPQIKAYVQARDLARDSGHSPTYPAAFRLAQLEFLPAELSFANPAALTAFLSLGLVAVVLLRPKLRESPRLAVVLLSVNLISPVVFCYQIIPHAPIDLWQRLLQGGPAQQEAMRLLESGHLRLYANEGSDAFKLGALFPREMQCLYRIHAINGYAALMPRNPYTLRPDRPELPREILFDYSFENGAFQKQPIGGLARFHWNSPSTRSVTVEEPSLNEILLRVGPGAPAVLDWTDSPDAGWTATAANQRIALHRVAGAFTSLDVPAGAQEIHLTYYPRFFNDGLVVAGLGGISLVLVSAVWRVNARDEKAVVEI